MPEDLVTWKRQLHQYPFRLHAAGYWFDYAKQSFGDPSWLTLAKDLFKPSKTLNFLTWARDFAWVVAVEMDIEDTRANFAKVTTSFCTEGATPLHLAAALGSVELCEWLITSGCDVSQMSRLGNPLHCAILGIVELACGVCVMSGDKRTAYEVDKDTCDVVQMLIDARADCKAHYRYQNERSLSCLELALAIVVDDGVKHPIRVLSRAGAPVNKKFLTGLAALAETERREEVRGFVDVLLECTMEHELKEDLLNLGLLLKSTEVLNQLQKDKGTVLDLRSIEILEILFRRAAKFDQRAVMEELLRSNRLDPKSASSDSGKTALHVAAENGAASAIELLLLLDAGVGAVDLEGRTPLHRSANSTNECCISLLLDSGAVVDAADDEGCTIWHLAAGLGNVEVLGVLLERVESKDSALALHSKDGLVPIFHAAYAQSSAAVMLLLPHTNHIPLSPDGLSLAHYGVQMNSVEILQALLKRGAPLDGRTEDGSTALHFIEEDAEPGLVRLLTTAGVEPASVTNEGDTPLHTLLRGNVNVEIEVFKLLATRDSVNMVNKDGFTALLYAVNIQNDGSRSFSFAKRKQYIETLIANGADLAARDPSGRSCLQILLDQFMQARQVVDNDNTGYPPDRTDYLADMITEVMGRVTDEGMLHEPCQGGLTPWAWALMERKETLMKRLVAGGINVDLRDEEQKLSALGYACFYGCSRELFRQMLQSSHQLNEPNGAGEYLPHVMCSSKSAAKSFLLHELLEAGVNPDSCWAPQGTTPMMIAARDGKLDHLQVLLENGANPYARDSNGFDILHVAAGNDQVLILRALENLDFGWSRGVIYILFE